MFPPGLISPYNAIRTLAQFLGNLELLIDDKILIHNLIGGMSTTNSLCRRRRCHLLFTRLKHQRLSSNWLHNWQLMRSLLRWRPVTDYSTKKERDWTLSVSRESKRALAQSTKQYLLNTLPHKIEFLSASLSERPAATTNSGTDKPLLKKRRLDDEGSNKHTVDLDGALMEVYYMLEMLNTLKVHLNLQLPLFTPP